MHSQQNIKKKSLQIFTQLGAMNKNTEWRMKLRVAEHKTLCTRTVQTAYRNASQQ